jgi:hypothetical protein
MKRPMSKAKALVNLQAAQEALEEAKREHGRDFVRELVSMSYWLLPAAARAHDSR